MHQKQDILTRYMQISGIERLYGDLEIVVNNRLPRLARYLQAVFIVANSFGRLNKLET